MKRTKNNVDLFLDSGAYSAWSKGVEINLDEYIGFIKQHEQSIEVYANLDVISNEETGNEKSARQTWQNQKAMEEAGLDPLPVFHYGEPLKYLKRYIKQYDYISLGGMVPVSNGQLISWLDKLFTKHLTDEQGMPLVKIHGFGLTSLQLMMRYPWYSVDSTSWVITGRTGQIFVPNKKGGEWVYDENARKVPVSNRSPGRKDDKNHISNLPPRQKQITLDYIHEKGFKLGESTFEEVDEDYEPKENERWAEKKDEAEGGKRLLEIIEEEGVSNRYQIRDEMNIIYFLDLEKSLPDWPWPFEKETKTPTLL